MQSFSKLGVDRLSAIPESRVNGPGFDPGIRQGRDIGY